MAADHESSATALRLAEEVVIAQAAGEHTSAERVGGPLAEASNDPKLAAPVIRLLASASLALAGFIVKQGTDDERQTSRTIELARTVLREVAMAEQAGADDE